MSYKIINNGKVVFGRNDGMPLSKNNAVMRFETVAEAEEFCTYWRDTEDKEGVERGDYYIDAPEELLNP